MSKYVLVLDVGTTNIKGILFDKKGKIAFQSITKPKYIMEEPGQMEQDPKQIETPFFPKHLQYQTISPNRGFLGAGRTKQYFKHHVDGIGLNTLEAKWLLIK